MMMLAHWHAQVYCTVYVKAQPVVTQLICGEVKSTTFPCSFRYWSQ